MIIKMIAWSSLLYSLKSGSICEETQATKSPSKQNEVMT